MTEHSNEWVVYAYRTLRLTIKQIADITNRDEKRVRKILEEGGALGGKSKKLKNVSRRKRNRRAAIIYLGGECAECGYNKCEAAFEFHHVKKNEKKFTISSGYKLPWEELKIELDKCMLLCCNCHREKHYYEKSPKGKNT